MTTNRVLIVLDEIDDRALLAAQALRGRGPIDIVKRGSAEDPTRWTTGLKLPCGCVRCEEHTPRAVPAARRAWTCRGEHVRKNPTDRCVYCGAPPGVKPGKKKPQGRRA